MTACLHCVPATGGRLVVGQNQITASARAVSDEIDVFVQKQT
jgi:hypothetical protein